VVYCGGALLLLLFSLLEHNLCHFLLVGGRTLAVGELQLDAAITSGDIRRALLVPTNNM
jgi:hypothetical protein